MNHCLYIEISGDCYQQRIFDLSEKSKEELCRAIIGNEDTNEMYSAISDDKFGDCLFELNYCTDYNDVNLRVIVDDSEIYYGRLFDFELQKEHQEGKGEIGNSNYIPCLVEQIEKEATFSGSLYLDDEDFDIKKLRILKDVSENSLLGDDKYLTSLIEYNGEIQDLDEDSSYYETIYGVGMIDNEGNLKCDDIIDEND